jgi:type IV pilus assembly protein PilX
MMLDMILFPSRTNGRPHARVSRLPGRETGAALIVSLIVLLILTLLGVAASRMSQLEERMTGNTQDAHVALQAAEAALRTGELFLMQPALPYFVGVDGLYEPAPATGPPLWETVDWDAALAVRMYGGFAGAAGSLARADASYFIEELPNAVSPGESLAADAAADEAKYYRITARGVGIGGRAVVSVQSTFKR